MRVLVVEDHPLIALTLADTLTHCGHEVIGPAADSSHAMELAERELPRMAFVDVDLESKGAGLDLARLLYEQQIAVVLTTGQTAAARKCECAVGLLSKPYDLDDAALAVPVVEAMLDGKHPPPPQIPASLEMLPAADMHPMTSAPLQEASLEDCGCSDILVVEDRVGDAALIAAALAQSNPADRVTVAHNSAEALDYLFSHAGSSPAPDVVLLSVQMPGRCGLDVLDAMKADQRLRSVPVVIMTSSDASEDVLECYEHGANACVLTPRGLPDYLANVQRVGRFWARLNRVPPPQQRNHLQ
jgi:two-component system response regulator